jgi:hypothetical protein
MPPVPVGSPVTLSAGEVCDFDEDDDTCRDPTVEVLKAVYGSDTVRMDVTEKVKSYLVRQRVLIFHVKPQALGCDPAPGENKYLQIRYKSGADAVTGKYVDDQLVYVAAPKGARVIPLRLIIDQAFFVAADGVGSRYHDVTAKVATYVVNGCVLAIAVDTVTLQCDPAAGVPKQLVVFYHVDADTIKQTSALEGSLLRIEV